MVDLFKAILDIDVEEVTRLLPEVPDINYQKRDSEGETILYEAVMSRNIDLVNVVLSHGANPNCGNIVWSALHFAVDDSLEDIVHTLLKHGADVNIGTLMSISPIYGWHSHAQSTPLHMAVINSSLSIMSLLLKAGANVRAVDEGGFSIVDKAVAHYGDRNIRTSYYRRHQPPQEKGLRVLKKLRLLLMAGGCYQCRNYPKTLFNLQRFSSKFSQIDFIDFLWTTGYKFVKMPDDDTADAIFQGYNCKTLMLKQMAVNVIRLCLTPNAVCTVDMLPIPQPVMDMIVDPMIVKNPGLEFDYNTW